MGLGDWGHAWIKPQWDELIQFCNTSIIYGNHDKVKLLRRLRNTDGSRVLLHDGETREIAGLRFGFINGVISETKHMKQGVPRKSLEEYVRVGSKLSGVDVLCTHESPLNIDRISGTEYHGLTRKSSGFEGIEKVITAIKPKLAFSGHLGGPYSLGKVGETLSLRVDSSPSEKHIALLDSETGILQVYHDWERVKSVSGIF